MIRAAKSRAVSSPAVSRPTGTRSAWTAGVACCAFIFIERLWRSVKYEEVYLNPYRIVADARSGLTNYFRFYNTERIHSSLDYQTPEEVCFKERCKRKPRPSPPPARPPSRPPGTPSASPPPPAT